MMMLRRIARPMLAAWFVSEGSAAFRGKPAHVDPARAGVDVLVERTGVTRPTDAQLRTIVKVHGAATVGAGLALALGKAPRLAALLLAALTFPSVVVNAIGSRKGTVSAAVKKERQDRIIRSVSFTG
ncbi:MAG: DoxX family protein, partial [Actinomycetes bacterium]